MKKSHILNIDIQSISAAQLLQTLDRGLLFTPNVDHLMNLQKDREFYEAYRAADFIVCDSQIVRLASRFLRSPIVETIAGSDFLSQFYHHHKNNPDIRLFLLGAREGVAHKAMQIINAKVGREIVIGAHSPSFGFERNESECRDLVRIVNDSRATVLIVGVGSPKQEKWIVRYKDAMPNIKIFMGLGATIDFEAGNEPRCPASIRRLSLEWAYRLCRDPKRMWRRYIINDLPFFPLIFKQRIGKYKDPFLH